MHRSCHCYGALPKSFLLPQNLRWYRPTNPNDNLNLLFNPSFPSCILHCSHRLWQRYLHPFTQQPWTRSFQRRLYPVVSLYLPYGSWWLWHLSIWRRVRMACLVNVLDFNFTDHDYLAQLTDCHHGRCVCECVDDGSISSDLRKTLIDCGQWVLG